MLWRALSVDMNETNENHEGSCLHGAVRYAQDRS